MLLGVFTPRRQIQRGKMRREKSAAPRFDVAAELEFVHAYLACVCHT